MTRGFRPAPFRIARLPRSWSLQATCRAVRNEWSGAARCDGRVPECSRMVGQPATRPESAPVPSDPAAAAHSPA